MILWQLVNCDWKHPFLVRYYAINIIQRDVFDEKKYIKCMFLALLPWPIGGRQFSPINYIWWVLFTDMVALVGQSKRNWELSVYLPSSPTPPPAEWLTLHTHSHCPFSLHRPYPISHWVAFRPLPLYSPSVIDSSK